jgi:DNA-binding CsgD family transcriptional regulator
MRRRNVYSHSSERLGALTARERQVAILAHGGLSNRSVARELNVSEGTVKQHLHSIFLKLHIRSRTALIIRKFPHDPRPDTAESMCLDDRHETSRLSNGTVIALSTPAAFRKS